jgi:hypothetical protein
MGKIFIVLVIAFLICIVSAVGNHKDLESENKMLKYKLEVCNEAR